jgi:hypothetical protein
LPAQPEAVRCAAPGDDRGDPPRGELASVGVVVVGAVGEQVAGSAAGPAAPAADRWDRFDQREQLGDVVAVPAGQDRGQRDSRSCR